MAVVGDIYNALDAFCPFDVHEQWDNVGLLVGESSAQVTKAAVVLDITPDAVERAHEAGAQLIISHHPVIFHPIKNLGAHDPVYLLAKYGMNAICAHTNLDCADGGVNDVLAQCLGLENVRKIPSPNAGTMLLRAGELREELSPKQFAELVSQRLCCHVRYCDGGCEALVSGDVAHHEFLGASACGVTLVAAGHFETENPVVKTIFDYLEKTVTDVDFFVISQQSPTHFI